MQDRASMGREAAVGATGYVVYIEVKGKRASMIGYNHKPDPQDENSYDTALICSNGHVVTNSIEKHPETVSIYCPECGERTTKACPYCEAKIRGFIETPGWRPPPYKLPLYCYSCGKPYDWTLKKLRAAKDFVDLIDSLDKPQKELLKEDIDTLSHNSPQAQVAAARFNKTVSKVSARSAATLRELVIEITNKTLKKILQEQAK